MKIPLDEITLPEYDLRSDIDEDALDELAASMTEQGQLQPIGVKRKDGGGFEVVFGARRTRAAWLNNWTHIEGNIIDQTETRDANAQKLIENVQRLDLTPIEEAHGIASLIGEGEISVRNLQRQTGKSREWIRTRLDLLTLPDDLQAAVQKKLLSIGVARAFGVIQNRIVRDQYVKMAAENGCTADQAVIWAGQAKFAESGILTMDEIQRTGIDITAASPIVDQHYHCFVCAQLTNWRRINALMICGGCQDAVVKSRSVPNPDALPYPLEI